MRCSGACFGMGLALVAAGVGVAGCHAGAGTLSGAGGEGILSGVGGRSVGGSSGGSGGVGGYSIITGSGGTYDDGCRGPLPAKPIPANIMMVLDMSSSMNDAVAGGSCVGGCGGASKWSAVTSGLDSVLGSQGPPVNWGLELIGVGDTCTAGAILVTTGEGTGRTIMEQLAIWTSGGNAAFPGNAPTREAIRIAALYLSGLPGLFVPGPQAILLVTDGEPDCGAGAVDPRAPDTDAAVASIFDAATRGVPTFVIGVGALDAAADDAMSRMAAAGGLARSGSPRYYPAADAHGVFDATNRLIATVGGCMFAVPDPPGTSGATSRDHISLLANGSAVPRDASHVNGWDYMDSSQTGVQVYGPVCDAIRAGSVASVTIVFNCLI